MEGYELTKNSRYAGTFFGKVKSMDELENSDLFFIEGWKGYEGGIRRKGFLFSMQYRTLLGLVQSGKVWMLI